MTIQTRRSSCGRLLLFLVACAFFAAASLSTGRLHADEAAKGAAVADADLFEIPDGDAAAIQEFMKKLAQTAPEGETEEEQVAFSVKALTTLVDAADRLLAAKPDDDQAVQANGYRIEALQALVAMSQDDAREKLDAAMRAARDDKREPIIGLGWQSFIMDRTGRWPSLEEQERQAFIAEIVDRIKQDGPQPIDVSIVQVTAMRLDGSDDDAVATLLEEVIPLFEKSDDKKVKTAFAEGNFDGMLRRLTLLGKPMEITGELLGGGEVDWESYRGKVVLVDFWATWCGPCVAEVPNILEMYQAYHDKGFEVLGVSLDATPKAAKTYVEENKLPWPSIFPQQEEDREWNNPLVRYYGITGIPTAILVGKDGNVVHMNARGEELRDQLQKLLGDPAEKPAVEKKPAEKKEAAAK